MRSTRLWDTALPCVYLVVLLLLVELGVRITQMPEYLLPAPSLVLQEVLRKVPVFLPHLAVTMTEALLGFVGGNVFAILFGFLFSQWRTIRQGFYPLIVGFQAVPIVAIAPFVIIWFGPGLAGKAFMAALICYFPATVIATNGFSRVNRDALAFMMSLGASRWRIFWSLQFPSAIPAIVSALQVSATLCTVGAIVAELSGASEGVGYLIIRASYEFRTVTLFAILAITSVATFALFKAVQLLGNRYGRRFTFSYAAPTE